MDGLIAEHISKTYAGTHGLSFAALRDVSIRLEPGSFTSLVGESGSGKSTLARLLVGLEAPDQGAIFLDGEDTSGWSTEDWRKRRTKLQAVFQDASGTLNPMRSVRSNVEEAMVNLKGGSPAKFLHEYLGPQFRHWQQLISGQHCGLYSAGELRQSETFPPPVY